MSFPFVLYQNILTLTVYLLFSSMYSNTVFLQEFALCLQSVYSTCLTLAHIQSPHFISHGVVTLLLHVCRLEQALDYRKTAPLAQHFSRIVYQSVFIAAALQIRHFVQKL